MRFKLANQVFALRPLWVMITLTAFTILINLSWWQLSRADEKAKQLSDLALQQSQGALSFERLNAVSYIEHDGALLQGQGKWLSPYIYLLDNQILQGKVGYDVIIPVHVNGLNLPLLVNLGWVAGNADRSSLPDLTIEHVIELDGLLRTKLGKLMLLGQNIEDNGSWPMRLQQLDFAEISEQIGSPLFAGLLYQQRGSLYIPHYKPVVLLPEKHRGYALQWFLLAVAVVSVALAASHQGKMKHE